MTLKPFWTSKTLWFNILGFVIAFATFLQSQPLTVKYAPIFTVVLTAGNFILRFFTNTGLTTNNAVQNPQNTQPPQTPIS